MRQILSDLRCFINDNSPSGETTQIPLFFKTVLDNPQTNYSGSAIIDGVAFNSLTFTKVNFAFIVSRQPFSLVLDNKIVMYTTQFSFANVHTVMDLMIYPRLRTKVKVEYLYGYVDHGAEESTVQLPDTGCAQEYDEILQNLIIDSTAETFTPDWAEDSDCDCQSCQYDSAIEDVIFVCGDESDDYE